MSGLVAVGPHFEEHGIWAPSSLLVSQVMDLRDLKKFPTQVVNLEGESHYEMWEGTVMKTYKNYGCR